MISIKARGMGIFYLSSPNALVLFQLETILFGLPITDHRLLITAVSASPHTNR
ncbi:MAG TPA: hypothetical protein VHS80_14530 [Chthoniobacterales bacterium]|nr:hypothetical protein [Chthoniobacterales bacterium]